VVRELVVNGLIAVPPALDKILAHVFLIAVGLLIVYACRRFDTWYRPRYEQEFQRNPGKRMGWDVVWMIVTGRAPILYVFVGPVLGWFLVGIGIVQLIDLATQPSR
jgi:hypothetical protein